ncbi:succinate dehydrogenase assembly factor 2 [Stappia sp. MMSF_3263]|uniref:FAD assembly factor SdhE n=1 Tax=Stappia sp. MMSF_3263 TaxID=3046693 RepID=UPI00273ED028|nr:succinate dehydrogenase assembly factor 2 [Stappia sp. MMSF_3263]
MAERIEASATGTVAGDEARRKRILYRCQHRGMKEMDILLGGYAKAHIGSLPDEKLDILERLMDVPDQDLFNWMIGRVAVPAEHDTDIYRSVVAFKTAGDGSSSDFSA